MNRIARFFLIVPAVCIAFFLACRADASPSKPNIIVYLSDDHGVDFSGCYGNKQIHTPNIDALAKDGMRFTKMFAASPTCSPSRAALWTGLYPSRNGTMGNHTDCRPGIQSLPDYLRPLGYRVVIADKLDCRPDSVFDFEHLNVSLPRTSFTRVYRGEGLDTNKVVNFLETHQKEHPDQPLCLVLGESNPHVMWERNKTYDPGKLTFPPFFVDTPITHRAMADYYQEITTMDERIGNVVAALKRLQYWDNTLFIYSSDQGPEWYRCKWTCYDTGLHVPFIASWPGRIKPGTVNDALISFVDVVPTFIDVAGGKSLPELDGRSFLGVFQSNASHFRDCVFGSHTADGAMNFFPQRSARDENFLYIRNLLPTNDWSSHFTKVHTPQHPDSHAAIWDSWLAAAKSDPIAAQHVNAIVHHPAEELYDTKNDPWQMHNIAADPSMRELLAGMRSKLDSWMAMQNDSGKEWIEGSPAPKK